MNELIAQWSLGDTSFGAPRHITLLNKPWGFYEFLGVPKDASKEDINRAYRRLSKELHPDSGGDEEKFKALSNAAEVLLDDGGDLCYEHGQRFQYDRISAFDERFPGHIEMDGERTKTLSEIMLIHFQLARAQAKFTHALEHHPRFHEVKSRAEKLAANDNNEAVIRGEMDEIVAEVLEMPVDHIKKRRKALREAEDKSSQETERFVDDFNHGRVSCSEYVLDFFYIGPGEITFGTEGYFRGGLCEFSLGKNVLSLVMTGACTLSRFRKVHFKAEQANVNLNDPNLEGLFHIVKGRVVLDYETTTYGKVIRVRSPRTFQLGGFAEHDDLYTPPSFAVGRWWEKKPAVEIAVMEGSVSLQLRSPRYEPPPKYSIIPYINSSGLLEELLREYGKKDSNKLDSKHPYRIIGDSNKDKYRI